MDKGLSSHHTYHFWKIYQRIYSIPELLQSHQKWFCVTNQARAVGTLMHAGIRYFDLNGVHIQ
jgi:hypothetical protein